MQTNPNNRETDVKSDSFSNGEGVGAVNLYAKNAEEQKFWLEDSLAAVAVQASPTPPNSPGKAADFDANDRCE